MVSPESLINLFINEPDIYKDIDFDMYPEINKVLFCGESSYDEYDQVDAILVGLKEEIDHQFLKRFPRARYIVSNTTGIDHIRVSEYIKIIHLDPEEIQEVTATSEFSLALLLALIRKIPFIDPECVSDRQAYRGTQLRGKRLGIFGMGRLGTKMARYAEALEMEWLGYDKRSTQMDKVKILKQCDIITIHLPLTEETIDFIGENEFNMMLKKPFIINTSRPQIINKKAILRAIDLSLISGIAMDFINYDGSNRWDPELRRYYGERLFLTPHLGGNTHESILYTAQVVVKKFVSLVKERVAHGGS